MDVFENDRETSQRTKLANQRCEACGRVFPVLYKARFDSSLGAYVDDGYDYVGNTCGCESVFAPDDGELSMSEWVDTLNAARHKAVTDHAVLFEMERFHDALNRRRRAALSVKCRFGCFSSFGVP